MKNNKSFSRFVRNFSENQSRYFLVSKIVIGAVGLLSVLTVSGIVYAGGGVGSGGGGGGGGGGHQSSYGWGWGIYQTNGAGPTSGFRNGTSWASVQATCRSAGAQSVYAFIIYDSGGNGEIYDYHSIYEAPPPFAAHFPAGISVDHNKATTINTGPGAGTAQAAFDSLPSKGVDTTGFTFGVNVAWFCYDLPTSAALDGVKIDNSGVSSSGSSSGYGGAYSGQQFSDDKVTISGVGNSAGNPFYFASIPAGNHTVSISDSGTADTNWQVFGYSICKGASASDLGSCTTQWLTQSGHISGGASFSYNFVVDGHYHMRWIFAPKGSPPPGGGATPLACPMVPTANVTAIPASFGAGNNGEVTGSTAPVAGNKYQIRSATSYHIVSATDANTGQSLPVNTANNTVDFTSSVNAYPYDPNSAHVTYNDTYNVTEYTYEVDKDGNGSWVVTGSGTGWTSGNFSDGSAALGECYPVHFNVDTATANSATLSNYENPSTANLTSTVSVHLWGSQGGSKRGALSVNGLTDTVSYTIHHLSGGTYPLGTSTSVSTSCGGGSTIDCEGPASPSTSVSVRVGSAQSQLQPGDTICATFTITPQKGDTDTGGTIQNGQAGTAAPSGQITSSSVCSPPVVNEPYFKVFGGDISAGDTFSVTSGVTSQCVASAAAASATVNGWNTANSTAYAPNPYTGHASDSYAGAGAQFSIMAINNINGVASAQNNGNADDVPNNTHGNGLAFANTGSDASGNPFATSFGESPACVPDYYSDKPGTTSNLSGSIPATADGAYSLSGGTIAGGTIGAGKHVVVYATGTVNITGNITFASGTYAVNDIPSFILVVKGNINISPSVTQLDGIYIAQPTNPAAPTDGTLSDCAGVSNANLWSGCANPLTVNGSFIANKIYLLRTGSGDPGFDNENSSIRAALGAESNSLSGTIVEDANKVSSCTSGVPDADGFCGNATYHAGSSGGYGPWTYAGSYTMQPGDDCYNAGCSGCYPSNPTTFKSCVSGNNETYYSRSYSAGSPGYYSCPSGETVSGSKCKASVTYACTDGSAPDGSHKCTIHVTATHASEVFNYNPAFWLTLSLQNVSSQNALKYDSIASLPPVL